MATVQGKAHLEDEFPAPPTDLIETDGEPLESEWHRMEIGLLIDSVRCQFSARTDFYAGGNSFIYFNEEQARNRDYRGPDFFFVWGVSSTPIRPYWAIWNEGGRYPDLIIELSSPTTVAVDHGVKKEIYEQVFRSSEYFCYDPETQLLEGWRREARRYQSIAADSQGRMWSEVLSLGLGTWQGPYQGCRSIWLRFFDAAGTIVPIFSEAERARADAERARAEAAEAELAELRKQVKRKRKRS